MAEHTLHRLSARVWWLTPRAETDRPTLGVVAGERGSLVIDAGASPAHAGALRAELERHALPAPRLVALTHWHWDHVFGAAALGVPAIASRETQRVLGVLAGLAWDDDAIDRRVAEGREIAFCRDMIRLELPDRAGLVLQPPEIAFADELALDLGGVTCRLIHIGGDHSPDGIAVHIPEEGVAFIGDALCDDLYHGPPRLTAGQCFPLLDRLLALDADHYVGGHDLAPIGRRQLAEDAAMFKQIGAAVARIGDDRDGVLAALPALLGGPPSDDHVAIADAFLGGLRLPAVVSPY